MLDLYHVALKPQLCLLDCSKESSAAFGLNKLRLPNDSGTGKGQMSQSCPGLQGSCLGPFLQLPRGFFL